MNKKFLLSILLLTVSGSVFAGVNKQREEAAMALQASKPSSTVQTEADQKGEIELLKHNIRKNDNKERNQEPLKLVKRWSASDESK